MFRPLRPREVANISDETVFLPATTLAQLIRRREVSSLEVVEAHLERIDLVNPSLHAVVQVAADRALEEARAADSALARGEIAGPLHGVPFTVKDWIETEGVVCAAGIEERRDYRPKRDATVVARMRAAGGIMLGKTKPGNDDRVYPRPNSPYDPSRSPGGSSGGEAAIIAAGGSPLGLGSDSGGSLRFPAHCCGVAAIKPTAGLVPTTGHFPRIGALSDPRTQVGPVARFVADLALALPVIAGPDWRDPAVVPMPVGDPDGVDVRGLRAAVFTGFAGAYPTAETAAAVKSAAACLARAGVEIEERAPPRIEEALEVTRAYWRRVRSYSWDEWLPEQEGSMTGEEVERSIFQWERLQRAMLAFLEHRDLVISPACPYPAPLHGAERDEDFICMLPYSLTGWPCVVVRAGSSPEGLPIGVQVAARPWRDHVALAVSACVEREMGGWQPPPA